MGEYDRHSYDAEAIKIGLEKIAKALHALGNKDASTPMGAIEAYGKHMGEKMDAFTDAINGLSESVDSAQTRHPMQGCICPAGADQTCQGPLCPRRNHTEQDYRTKE